MGVAQKLDQSGQKWGKLVKIGKKLVIYVFLQKKYIKNYKMRVIWNKTDMISCYKLNKIWKKSRGGLKIRSKLSKMRKIEKIW